MVIDMGRNLSKVTMEVCPDCGKRTVVKKFDSNMMGDFEYKLCLDPECHFLEMLSSQKPVWLRREERESLPHRVLPSGDIEYADEYGGY